jgi:hypothetical protein
MSSRIIKSSNFWLSDNERAYLLKSFTIILTFTPSPTKDNKDSNKCKPTSQENAGRLIQGPEIHGSFFLPAKSLSVQKIMADSARKEEERFTSMC